MQFNKSNNAILFSCLVLFLTPFLSSAQTQFSEDIYGKNNGDQVGYNLFMLNSNTVVVGSPFHSNYGTNAGQVRVFQRKGSKWVQKGNDTYGNPNSYAGITVCMPDSNTYAMGLINRVRIFKWNGSSWVTKGNDIVGDVVGDGACILDMPNSHTIAIGAPLNDGNGKNAGHVRVFKWNGNRWTQIGNDLEGKVAQNRFGTSICMPDSITLAISAPWRTSTGLPPIISPNYVQVYRWNGSFWAQMGNDIKGDSTFDFGLSISMPNSETIAIGTPENKSGGNYEGQVRI